VIFRPLMPPKKWWKKKEKSDPAAPKIKTSAKPIETMNKSAITSFAPLTTQLQGTLFTAVPQELFLVIERYFRPGGNSQFYPLLSAQVQVLVR
jgi:hypothetical protein